MVDRAEVFRVADEILNDERVQPTVRSVRERLVQGGSFSDIGPHFAAWAALRGFRLRPARHDLPGHLLDRLATVAAEIWRDGLRAGGVAAHNEMDRLTRERDAVQAVADEAMAYANELEARLAETERLDAEAAVQGAERRQEPKAFWAGVMREIVELLRDRQLSVTEILDGLSDETIRLAPELRQRGGTGLLAYKMRYHAKRDRYFVVAGRDVFRRRA